jgi:hypothetical protein
MQGEDILVQKMKTEGEVRVQLQAFLTSAPDEKEFTQWPF